MSWSPAFNTLGLTANTGFVCAPAGFVCATEEAQQIKKRATINRTATETLGFISSLQWEASSRCRLGSASTFDDSCLGKRRGAALAWLSPDLRLPRRNSSGDCVTHTGSTPGTTSKNWSVAHDMSG